MRILVEAFAKWSILIVFVCSIGMNTAQASALSSCWERVSERSEFRYTPPGITVNLPPDIAFDYGSFRNGYMLLPAGMSPMKWYLVSEDGKGYELRFPEKSGTFNLQLPNGKSVRVRHGRKVSMNSFYPASLGKEFEEIGWGADSAVTESLRVVPVADPNVRSAVDGELTRRMEGLAELYHSYGGTREDEGMNVSEAAYLDVLETCRKVSPAIATAADRVQSEIRPVNRSVQPPAAPTGLNQKQHTSN